MPSADQLEAIKKKIQEVTEERSKEVMAVAGIGVGAGALFVASRGRTGSQLVSAFKETTFNGTVNAFLPRYSAARRA